MLEVLPLIRPVFWVGLVYWAWVPIIGAFIESQYVAGENYLVPQKWVRSECYLECEPPIVNVVRGRPVSQGVWNDTIPHRFHTRVWSGT